MVQDIDPKKTNYVGAGKTIADYPGRINLNLPGRPVKRDWLHCNSLDYNAELGQIVTNSVQGEFYVIDHDNTFIPGNPDSSIALAGKDLTPQGPITSRTPDYLTPDDVNTAVSGSSNPAKFLLKQNHPNPFNPQMVIPYQLETAGEVQLKI